MNTRLISAAIAASLFAGSASAFAATDHTPDFPIPSSCKQSTTSATTKNKCFADMQKQWTLQAREFTRKQAAEMKEWRIANPQVISEEWTKANIAFSEKMKNQALEFRNQQKEDRKVFFDAFKESVASPDPHLTSSGKQPMYPGQEECFVKYQEQQNLPDWLQLCLRKANIEYRLSLREKARLNGGSSSSSSSSVAN